MKYEKKEKLTSGVTSTLSGTKHIHSERVREKFTYIKKKKEKKKYDMKGDRILQNI